MPVSIENRADNLPPSDHEIKEMSVAVALRKVVDDLFTCKAVADKLQGAEDNSAIEALINHHKLILVEHLEEVGWRSIAEFLAQLDNLQTQPGLLLPFSPV